MRAIERGIVLICQAVMWITTAVIFVILCANTLLRYARGGSVQWANEVPELLFPWLVMAGIVLAAVHGTHIATTFIADRLTDGPRRMLAVVAWLIVAALYATLVVATARMLEIVHDEKSPILGVPSSVTYACVMLGMAMLSLIALSSAWRSWTGQGQAGAAVGVNIT